MDKWYHSNESLKWISLFSSNKSLKLKFWNGKSSSSIIFSYSFFSNEKFDEMCVIYEAKSHIDYMVVRFWCFIKPFHLAINLPIATFPTNFAQQILIEIQKYANFKYGSSIWERKFSDRSIIISRSSLSLSLFLYLSPFILHFLPFLFYFYTTLLTFVWIHLFQISSINHIQQWKRKWFVELIVAGWVV